MGGLNGGAVGKEDGDAWGGRLAVEVWRGEVDVVSCATSVGYAGGG